MAASNLILRAQTMMADDATHDDVRTLLRARSDPKLFAPVYERYVDRIYAYCLRRTGNPQDAEDLCSRTFALALKNLNQYRSGSVPAWLYAIAHSVVMRHYRDHKRQGRDKLSALDAVAELVAVADNPYETVDQRAFTDSLMADLSEHEIQLLSLALDVSLTSAEIGSILKRNPSTVRVEIHRIIKKLRHRHSEVQKPDERA